MTQAKYLLRAYGKPAIEGTAAVESTLSTRLPDYEYKPSSISYQWLANGSPIPGATSAQYTVTSSVAGKRIAVAVTATRPGYVASSTESVATAAVPGNVTTNPTPAPTPSPSVTAKALKNSAKPSISGTTNKLTISHTLVGKKLNVTVTAKKSGYSSAQATSAQSATVAKSQATISGKLKKSSIKSSSQTTVTVKVTSAGYSKPTGTVTVKVGSKKVTAKTKGSHKGTITVTLKGSQLKRATSSPSQLLSLLTPRPENT